MEFLHELVAANRILADHGVIDAYGHVSLRSPDNPNRYFLARSLGFRQRAGSASSSASVGAGRLAKCSAT